MEKTNYERPKQRVTYRELLTLLASGIALMVAAYGCGWLVAPFVSIGPGAGYGPGDILLLACLFMFFAGSIATGVATLAIIVKSTAMLFRVLWNGGKR